MTVQSKRQERALVVLSGGQDSTTCLFWAKREYEHVSAVCFSYSQRHARETQSARKVAGLAGVECEMVDLGPVFAGLSPLTDKSREVGRYASADVLPGGLEETFVPCRNMMFLTLAANRAYVLGASAIIIGVSQEDYGGYPDCRESFLTAAQAALNLGLERKIEIIAPLVHRTKRETVELATELDGALDALGYSHTCYAGEFPPCGHCHACLLRQRGFSAAGIRDPLVVRAQGALA